MKTVSCGQPTCGARRVHWAHPDTPRGVQTWEVEDDFNTSIPMFCSIECMLYAKNTLSCEVCDVLFLKETIPARRIDTGTGWICEYCDEGMQEFIENDLEDIIRGVADDICKPDV